MSEGSCRDFKKYDVITIKTVKNREKCRVPPFHKYRDLQYVKEKKAGNIQQSRGMRELTVSCLHFRQACCNFLMKAEVLFFSFGKSWFARNLC